MIFSFAAEDFAAAGARNADSVFESLRVELVVERCVLRIEEDFICYGEIDYFIIQLVLNRQFALDRNHFVLDICYRDKVPVKCNRVEG